MVWDNETPEYREQYIAYPRIVAGPQFGNWLFVEPHIEINIAQITSWDWTDRDGWTICLSDGRVYNHVPSDARALWVKMTVPTPAEAEQLHAQRLGIARAHGPLRQLGG